MFGQQALTLVALAAALVSVSGCVRFTAPYKVATYQNDYKFHNAVDYGESCPPAPATAPSWCLAYYRNLLNYEKHLHLAAEAVQAGGALPPQLKQLKVDEKAVKK